MDLELARIRRRLRSGLLAGLGAIACAGRREPDPASGARTDRPAEATRAGGDASGGRRGVDDRARGDRRALVDGATDRASTAAEGARPGSSLHPCEASCGRVGDCLREDPQQPRGGASALEISCVGMCLAGGPPLEEQLAACEGEHAGCRDYLTCVAGRWSTPARAEVEVDRSRETRCAKVCDIGDCFMELWTGTGVRADPVELDQQRRAYEQFVEQSCVRGCVDSATATELDAAEQCGALACSERLQCVMTRDFVGF